MHDIPMSEVTPEFARCWQAAGMHIERAAGGQLNAWLGFGSGCLVVIVVLLAARG